MAAVPPLKVACILERYYNLSLESTLQEFGFEDEDVSFIKPVGQTDAVADTLTGAEYEWAAQHVCVWRTCEAGQSPMLVFQEDVRFSPVCSDVLAATKALVAAAEETGATRLLFLGAAVPDVPPQFADLGSSGCTAVPARGVSQTTAYVIWPTVARQLLELLPLSVPVTAFMSKLVEEHRVSAMMASPALIQPIN